MANTATVAMETRQAAAAELSVYCGCEVVAVVDAGVDLSMVGATTAAKAKSMV